MTQLLVIAVEFMQIVCQLKTYLIIWVGEIQDHDRYQVSGESGWEVGSALMQEHGDVWDLFHELSPHCWLWEHAVTNMSICTLYKNKSVGVRGKLMSNWSESQTTVAHIEVRMNQINADQQNIIYLHLLTFWQLSP